MSTYQIILEQNNSQTKIAVTDNGVLKEVEFFDQDGVCEGNIYLGKIVKKISLANDKIGYFVDINDSREAFINAEENDLSDLVVTEGQDVVVQVSQEKRAEKGAKLVRALQFVGNFLVYCPYKMNVEASARIENQARLAECKELVVDNTTGQEGWILRTDIVKATDEEIVAEMNELRGKFDKVCDLAKSLKSPELLLAKRNPIYDYIKRYKNSLSNIVVNNHIVEKDLEKYFTVEYSKEPFKEFGIDEELSNALQQCVRLKSGGRIFIEETKAFVAIDVDTGDDNSNGNIPKTNIEAAKEIAKQIILRNLSGKIIIDFAGASEYKFLKPVIDTLESELRNDYSKNSVLGLSRAGNVEVLRVRKRSSLQNVLTVKCDACAGLGRIEK